jgi:hypothetical protein
VYSCAIYDWKLVVYTRECKVDLQGGIEVDRF